jgi:hypothetical protein
MSLRYGNHKHNITIDNSCPKYCQLPENGVSSVVFEIVSWVVSWVVSWCGVSSGVSLGRFLDSFMVGRGFVGSFRRGVSLVRLGVWPELCGPCRNTDPSGLGKALTYFPKERVRTVRRIDLHYGRGKSALVRSTLFVYSETVLCRACGPFRPDSAGGTGLIIRRLRESQIQRAWRE